MGCELPVLRLRRDRLLHVATKVFGDAAKARAWIKAPNPALGNKTPDESVDTRDGLERALSELESIGG